MGLTFKEIARTCAIRAWSILFKELGDYSVRVDVYGPLGGSTQNECGIELVTDLSGDYDGIVLAVGHASLPKWADAIRALVAAARTPDLKFV